MNEESAETGERPTEVVSIENLATTLESENDRRRQRSKGQARLRRHLVDDYLTDQETRKLAIEGVYKEKQYVLDCKLSKIDLQRDQVDIKADVDSTLLTFKDIPDSGVGDVEYYSVCNSKVYNINEDTKIKFTAEVFEDGVGLTDAEKKMNSEIDTRNNVYCQDYLRSTGQANDQEYDYERSVRHGVEDGPGDLDSEPEQDVGELERCPVADETVEISPTYERFVETWTTSKRKPGYHRNPKARGLNTLFIPLHTIPNFCIARLGDTGAAYLYILFPRLRRKNTGGFQTILCKVEFRNFYNKVLAPAMATLENVANDFIPDYDNIDPFNALGHMMNKTHAMQSLDFAKFMSAARKIVNESEEPCVKVFKGFFFHLQIKGIKDKTRIPISETGTLLKKLEETIPALSAIRAMDDPFKSLYIDVGFEYGAEDEWPTTMLWDGPKLMKLFTAKGYYKPKIDQYMRNSEVHGIRCSITDLHREADPDAVVYTQAYFTDKGQNYVHHKVSGGASRMSLNTCLNQTEKHDKKLQLLQSRFEGMEEKSWNVRYEVRIPIDVFEKQSKSVEKAVCPLLFCF